MVVWKMSAELVATGNLQMKDGIRNVMGSEQLH
jgi:hypothetical protein